MTTLEAELTLCDREPIHVPGSIQPHGMMLVAELSGLIVRHVAGDVEQHLGVTDWAGQALAASLGETLTGRVAALLEQNSSGFAGQILTPDGKLLDVSAYPSGVFLIVELEPASEVPLPASWRPSCWRNWKRRHRGSSRRPRSKRSATGPPSSSVG